MIDQPTIEVLKSLMGPEQYALWNEVNSRIEAQYDTDRLWNKGYRDWDLEYKYRRGGKTLCTFYIRKHKFACQVVFGMKEREKFERDRASYSLKMQELYDSATTYHDGKWMLIPIDDTSYFEDIARLLQIKRRPNRKENR